MRKPEAAKGSHAANIKALFHKEGKGQSLKEFARNLIKEGGEAGKWVKDWLYNKNANTANPPKGIGRTSKKKSKGGGGGKKES
jgi:hypothetical protein